MKYDPDYFYEDFHHDFETRSRLSLPDVGSSRYSRDESTRVLMLAYAFGSNHGSIRQWVPAEGEKMPPEVRDAMTDPRVRKIAWNKPFEWSIWTNTLGIETPHSVWTDPMVVAMTISLPGKLEIAGPILGLDASSLKSRRGRALINKFSKPRKPTKAKPWEWATADTDYLDWLDFLWYNRQDVKAEIAIWHKIRRWDLTGIEREGYEFDQRSNQRGLPINMEMVRNARRVYDELLDEQFARMRELTGLANPNSGAQLLPWLQDQGYPLDDLKKGHVQRAIDREYAAIEARGNDFADIAESGPYIEVLELRQETSKTSVKKYDALIRATDEDNHLRQTLQFAGAPRTGRGAGRSFQGQNLVKPTKELEDAAALTQAAQYLQTLSYSELALLYARVIDVLTSCIRPSIQAPPGHKLVDVDLSAIENIVLGWMSGERKILTVFEEGRDPYLDFAQYLFHMLYADLQIEFKAGNKKRRNLSKPGVLGCGYLLGPGAEYENEQTGEIEASGLLGYAWNMGVKDFTLADSKLSVSTWRNTYTDAVAYWKTIEAAAKRCLRAGRPQEAGPVEFYIEKPFMRMRLPSGRSISYLRPKIENKRAPWGDMKETITYEGLNDKKQWVRLTTHPGKLTENGDQAIARDLLLLGMLRAEYRGLDIRLHVHDQGVALAKESEAERQLEILKECFTEPPEWGLDIPLNCGGFTSQIFMKD